MAQIVELNLDNFAFEVEKSTVPVLVDFWASWCGPCRLIAPTVEKLAQEYEGKLKVCKVNVDEEEQLASAFSVLSIPMLAVFRHGKIVDQLIGANPSGIRAMVEKELAQ